MIKVHKQNANRWLVFHTKSDDTCYIVKAYTQVMGESISFFRLDNSQGITIAAQLETYNDAKKTAINSIK